MSCSNVEPSGNVVNKDRSNRIEISVVVVTVIVTDLGDAVGFGYRARICCLTLHTMDASTQSSYSGKRHHCDDGGFIGGSKSRV